MHFVSRKHLPDRDQISVANQRRKQDFIKCSSLPVQELQIYYYRSIKTIFYILQCKNQSQGPKSEEHDK